MTVTLGLNIASLRSQRQLARSSDELSNVFTRLASGQRINSASDDAAGLAIADSLRADARVYNQGVRNLNDGISVLNIADGALQELTNITFRLTELAEQAANGTLGVQQRASLDEEAQALKAEYFRIVQSTEFNGRKILAGSGNGQLNLQAGIGVGAVLEASVGGAIGIGLFQNEFNSFTGETTVTNSVRIADLNGDGLMDLVSAGGAGLTGYATVRLGKGDGTFDSATSYSMNDRRTSELQLADLNGDGHLDMIAIAPFSGFTTRYGDGTGSFGAAQTYSISIPVEYSLAVGDINGDGVMDVVVGGIYGAYEDIQTNIFIGDGESFTEVAMFVDSQGDVSADETTVRLVDVDNDNDLDIVTTDGGTSFAAVRLNSGSGTFASSITFDVGIEAFDVKFGDINGDGFVDFVAAGTGGGSGRIEIRLGSGDGTFGSATTYQTDSYTNTVELADLNSDGMLDIITGGRDASIARTTTVLMGQGDGTFGTATSYVTGSGAHLALAIADIDNDGVLDIVAGGSSGVIQVRKAQTEAGVSSILDFSLSTLAGARQALPLFQNKLDQLTRQRGEVGSFQSRIEVAERVLTVSVENFRAAESRIRDADIAQESANLVRLQILQQAASAVLGQANQQPQLVLQLLGGNR